jgi:hypothetical protein
MAIFDPNSRYTESTLYRVLDRRGRRVVALAVPPAPEAIELGLHQRRQGQRLDQLANFYLDDPNGFWRIAELNQVMLPDALAEAGQIRIPAER